MAALLEVGIRPLVTVCDTDGGVDLAFTTACGRGLLLRCTPLAREAQFEQLATILEQGPFAEGYSLSGAGLITDRRGRPATVEDILGIIKGRPG